MENINDDKVIKILRIAKYSLYKNIKEDMISTLYIYHKKK